MTDLLELQSDKDVRLRDLPPPRLDGTAVIYTGRVARTGVLVYPWGIERRDDSELRRVVAQLDGKPITQGHPNGLTLAAGGSVSVVGRTSHARKDGAYAVAALRIESGVAQRVIKDGTRQLSLGYSVEIDSEGYQRNTIVDHVALVESGRCGPECSLRADCHQIECVCHKSRRRRVELVVTDMKRNR